jgi:hypothetical protein
MRAIRAVIPRRAQVAADPWVVIALVGVQLDRPASGMPASAPLDRRHRVQDRLDEHAVVPVRAGDGDIERQARGVDEQVVLGAAFAPVGGVRAGQCTPLFARTLTLSRLARDQSRSPRSPS